MQQLGLLSPGAWSVRADAWRAVTPSPPCGTLQQICSCASPLLSRRARWLLPRTPPHVRQPYAQATHTASNTVACFSMPHCLLQDPSAIQAAHSSAPLPEEFNAMAFLSAKGKGKPVAGVCARTGSARAVVSVKARLSATGSNTGTRNSQGHSYVCLTGSARAVACAGLRKTAVSSTPAGASCGPGSISCHGVCIGQHAAQWALGLFCTHLRVQTMSSAHCAVC